MGLLEDSVAVSGWVVREGLTKNAETSGKPLRRGGSCLYYKQWNEKGQGPEQGHNRYVQRQQGDQAQPALGEYVGESKNFSQRGNRN